MNGDMEKVKYNVPLPLKFKSSSSFEQVLSIHCTRSQGRRWAGIFAQTGAEMANTDA